MSIPLTAITIPMLDEGRAGTVIDAAIKAAMQDTEDRGDDEKPRKVVITLTFLKEASNVYAKVDVASKVPAYRTAATQGKIGFQDGRPQMKFSPDSADNPDQSSYPMDDDKA